MKLSTRGSIRKAPNAISWVFSLVNMSVASKYDPSSLIRAWSLDSKSMFKFTSLQLKRLTLDPLTFILPRNEDCAKHDKLVGAKHQAVKQLLQLNEACRNAIFHTVSTYGWEGAWPGMPDS